MNLYTVDVNGTLAMFQSYEAAVTWLSRFLKLDSNGHSELRTSASIIVDGQRYKIARF